MGREVVQDVQPAFSGGLNLTADPSQVQPTQVRDATNARLSEYGGVGKRLGSVRLTEDPLIADTAIQNGTTWYRTADSQILIVTDGTLFTSAFVAPAVQDFITTSSGDDLATEDDESLITEIVEATMTNQGSGLSTTNTPDFASFLYTAPADTECVFIADGGALNRWDGTTLTLDIAGTPDVAQIVVYNQRLFGVSGEDQSIFYSDLNNGNSLGNGSSGGGEAIIRTFGDQNTTGLAVSGSSLLIFHRSGISRWTGFTQDDIAIAAGAQGITGEVGTTTPFSIVEVSGQVFFLGQNGFYRVSETSPPESISVPIDSLVREWDEDTIAGVRGVHVRNYQEVRWWVPNVGVMVYNYRLNAWSGPWTGGFLEPATTCLFESMDDQGRFTLLRGDADGWLTLNDVDDIFLDNLSADFGGGTAFAMRVQPHRFFANDYMAEKSLRWGYVVIDPRGTDDVVMEWTTQTGSGTSTIDPDSLAVENRAVFRFPMADRGEWVDMAIVDSGEADALYSRVEIQAFNMGRRGNT